MDNETGYCFPSTRALSKATGFSERTICTHLIAAAKAGWIIRGTRGKSAKQAWAGHEYWPAFPPGLSNKGTEPRSAPKHKGAEPGAEGAEPDDKKALNDVQSNSSINSSKNSSDGEVTRKSHPPEGYFENVKDMMGRGKIPITK